MCQKRFFTTRKQEPQSNSLFAPWGRTKQSCESAEASPAPGVGRGRGSNLLKVRPTPYRLVRSNPRVKSEESGNPFKLRSERCVSHVRRCPADDQRRSGWNPFLTTRPHTVRTSLKRMGRPRHMHTHTTSRCSTSVSRRGSVCCHPSAVSLAGCFGCRSPRVKGSLPSPLSTCPLYPVGPCMPALSQSLTLSCRRRGGGDLGRFCGVWVD
jgi:hypothetical protein